MRSLITVVLGIFSIGVFSAFEPLPELKVSSPAFKHNGRIPVKYTCEGDNVSPALHIENIPVGTRTLAIIVHDPDAPKPGGITHWLVWNIEPASEIAAQYTGVFQGKNSADNAVYMGPCPPSGTHHYHFRVYALDARMDVPAGITDKAGLEKAMQGHILAEGLLTGLYRKVHPPKP